MYEELLCRPSETLPGLMKQLHMTGEEDMIKRIKQSSRHRVGGDRGSDRLEASDALQSELHAVVGEVCTVLEEEEDVPVEVIPSGRRVGGYAGGVDDIMVHTI
jgi:hypothetical protein